MATAAEVTGLTWELAVKQPTVSEDEARRVEQALLAHYAGNRLASNGEIIEGASERDIMSKLAIILREGWKHRPLCRRLALSPSRHQKPRCHTKVHTHQT
jgi:hypothetical protein